MFEGWGMKGLEYFRVRVFKGKGKLGCFRVRLL